MTVKTQTEIVTLKQLCEELKVKPREARMMLRLAVSNKSKYPTLAETHIGRQPWKWTNGSKEFTEAKQAILQKS